MQCEHAPSETAIFGAAHLRLETSDDRVGALDAVLADALDDVAQHAKTGLGEADEHQAALHHAGGCNFSGSRAAGYGHSGKCGGECIREASCVMRAGKIGDDVLDVLAIELCHNLGNRGGRIRRRACGGANAARASANLIVRHLRTSQCRTVILSG